MAIHKGVAIIWGVKEECPIVNIPSTAERVRVRMRPMRPAIAFVKYPNRIEQWIIFPNGPLDCTEWKLGQLQAVNVAQQPSYA